MRRRLLIVLTAFAAIAVLAFAVPLSLTAATSRTQQLVLGRSGDADRFATLADAAGSAGGVQALADEVGRYHELYGENVLVVDARGAPVVNAGVDVRDPRIMAAVAAARRNQRPQQVDRLTPWSDPVMLIARPVGSGVQVNGAVVIEASTDEARAAIARVWAVIAVGAVAAMVVFVLLALVVSRWVLRPLAAMSDAVAELTATLPRPRPEPVGRPAAQRVVGPAGRSAFDQPSGSQEHPTEPGAAPITRRYGGPPEVRALAESVDAMAAAVADSADAQRQLVADTAHAMRNPLAALTIRLDSLEAAIPASASATFRGASAEVDRLTALLDALLELAVAEAPAAFGTAASAEERCDATEVVADRIDSWTAAFAEAGMTLTALGQELSAAQARAGEHRGGRDDAYGAAISAAALAQILDVALSNSCRYAGPGAHTVVDVLTEPSWVIVRVRDDGAGVDPAEIDKLTARFFRGSGAVAGGTGLGLSIAHALAKARGGTLTVEPVLPHGLGVVIRLPAVRR
ncbi:HAMP domain-containing histidine kinase [Nocardia cyriacigeorgica]|uniref:sensor histidine kinase n=3 Tax=Nocardia cyriacigeorgica TaxID=135487 RepID=UPI001895062B|nr:HAMP domain-containing sensor histidine kinase [Nocardia cyriacigeorgica]MBF6425690.1 HAMP domain-containing histidine kinase [Nocardia cyriacigeorgica]BDU04745.1 two-component sensor histidine kinase [Nocardia cyriacigeorgica]